MQKIAQLNSPDDRIELEVLLDDAGALYYTVRVDGEPLIAPSRLGLRFKNAPDLVDGFSIEEIEKAAFDTTWETVWGPSSKVRDYGREVRVKLVAAASGSGTLVVVFRAYDDGVALRYELSGESSSTQHIVTDELTEFRFAQAGNVWWTPADYDSYEYLYEESPLNRAEAANTPVTVESQSGTLAAIHEAALVDFSEMTLELLPDGRGYRAGLVPFPDGGGVKARIELPFQTPWRTITIGRTPGDLIESNLILNLNEPCKIDDTSWIEPGTYIGIWWVIHKGQATWRPGEHLAATTANAKRYIDFAAKHGISYVLVEGWNVGWRDDWKEMDFTEAQDRFDLDEVVHYADERGVEFIAHMETGANPRGLEAQLDDAFERYRSLGIRAVKTGYVGDIPDHYHHDQWMVRHHQRVVEKAAEYGIMVDAHEPVKPTGLERTWPNAITREAVRGMEYNAWSEGNPPSHTVTLPFTRMVAGPLDYTPGIFRVDWDPRKLPEAEVLQNNDYDGPTRVHTTRARQMALCVVFLSGLQMLADLPEHYEGEPEFAFMRRLPATWDETRVLSGEIGKHLIIVRRSGEEWFVAAINDENFQAHDIHLEFLVDGAYKATIYADADGTDYRRRPNDVMIERKTVSADDVLQVELGGGGGWAARIVPE